MPELLNPEINNTVYKIKKNLLDAITLPFIHAQALSFAKMRFDLVGVLSFLYPGEPKVLCNAVNEIRKKIGIILN